MVISKFQYIKGYRIFDNMVWPEHGLMDFGRFNLIYGWNGTGKTTLSTLLSHLQTKSPIQEGEISIIIDGKSINGHSLDKSPIPQVSVFNRNTVAQNVFEIPHHQLPPIVVLGDENVEKQKNIEALKVKLQSALTDLNSQASRKRSADEAYETFCSDRAREIKILLTAPGGGPYNNYDKADYKNVAAFLNSRDYPLNPLNQSNRLKHEETNIGRSMDLLEVPPLTFPDLIKLTSEVQAILSKSVSSTVLHELSNNPEMRTWVREGLRLHTPSPNFSGKCGFCDSTLSPERLALLEQHFDEEYRKFQGEISSLINNIQIVLKQVKEFSPPPKSAVYPHLEQQFEEHVAKFNQQRVSVVAYLNALMASLTLKSESPFRDISLIPFLQPKMPVSDSPGILEQIFHLIVTGAAALGAISGQNAYSKICELFREHNNHTNNYEEELAISRRALELDEALKSIDQLTVTKQAAVTADEVLRSNQMTVNQIGAEIAALESSLRHHQKPAEELNREMIAFLGRDELRFEVKETGYVMSRNGQPAMHLSEGERTAIAFMYFLKSLSSADISLDKTIIVIDDPVSSLDMNSMYSAFGFMKAATSSAAQLFILTHNFSFFRLVKNWFKYLPKPERKRAGYYMLQAYTNDSKKRACKICALDPLLKNYESEYHYLFKLVLVASKSDAASLESYYGLPNVARRLLESFMAFRVPEGENLHQQLDMFQVEPARKARLLRFLDTYSHHEQITPEGNDFSVLTESRAILLDLLNLIREKDEGHYRAMSTLCALD